MINITHKFLYNFKINKPLLVVFFTIFIDMLGVGILIPVIPLLILPNSEFIIIPESWSVASGFILLGWLSASFPLSQFIFSPILGQLSDRFGRKIILSLCTFGTAIAYITFAFGILTKNIPLMFFSRIIDGITGGSISVAQAVIADISTPQNRAKNFSIIGMAFGLGFILGPFIGGKLTDPQLIHWFNAATPFYFTALLSIINMLFILKFLPETIKERSQKKLNLNKSLFNIFRAINIPGLRNVMPTIFFFNAGFTFFTTFFAVTLANKYHLTQGEIGNYFAYLGIMIIFAQGIFVRKVAKTAKDFQVLRFSMFGTGICLTSYFFIQSNYAQLIYLVPPFLAIFNALTSSFTSALITRITPVNTKGEAMGINSSVMAIAQAIPAILSGYIASIYPTLPILTGSATIFIGGILFWILFKPKQYQSSL